MTSNDSNENTNNKSEARKVSSNVDNNSTFNYQGYQIVRKEFFSPINEPSLTFNNFKVYVNTACIRNMPNVNYIQFLVNPVAKTLVLKPGSEDDKDSILWCTNKDSKRKPKQITCSRFFAKIAELLGWNLNYRYKILGNIIKSKAETILIFDLKSVEVFKRDLLKSYKLENSQMPVFPIEWKNQFGLPPEEHNKIMKINVFDDYTVLAIQNDDAVIVNQGK